MTNLYDDVVEEVKRSIPDAKFLRLPGIRGIMEVTIDGDNVYHTIRNGNATEEEIARMIVEDIKKRVKHRENERKTPRSQGTGRDRSPPSREKNKRGDNGTNSCVMTTTTGWFLGVPGDIILGFPHPMKCCSTRNAPRMNRMSAFPQIRFRVTTKDEVTIIIPPSSSTLGSFEVTVNGNLMHSKLDTGQFPDEQEIADKVLEEHMRNTESSIPANDEPKKKRTWKSKSPSGCVGDPTNFGKREDEAQQGLSTSAARKTRGKNPTPLGISNTCTDSGVGEGFIHEQESASDHKSLRMNTYTCSVVTLRLKAGTYSQHIKFVGFCSQAEHVR
ncbi:unnamed protein product [Notodromas monacha]|uniref:Uncharacterized protein n=1 Tax=Notodromas monacha TaxID=399045 RepID=A0A7R9BG10_9CRUS|nr:unnamed protein product [Notodromas monacha]CAG0913470.1 unnamed protein product [Notodromas monacha]